MCLCAMNNSGNTKITEKRKKYFKPLNEKKNNSKKQNVQESKESNMCFNYF